MMDHGHYYPPSHSPSRGRSLIRAGERAGVVIFGDLGGEWKKEGELE
jgi:hypothetical protein